MLALAMPLIGLLLPRHRHRQVVQEVTDADYRASFVDGLGFGLDPFQVEAIDAVDSSVNVLVSAPTGSGKTLIANYAIGRDPRTRGTGLLHDAAQGAVEPEVQRTVRTSTAHVGWASHGRRSINRTAPKSSS